MTILDLNAPGYTMLHWLTILLENREFDTSAPLAAEAKEYLMNTFHLDYLKPIIQNDKEVKSFRGLTVFCCGIVEFYLI